MNELKINIHIDSHYKNLYSSNTFTVYLYMCRYISICLHLMHDDVNSTEHITTTVHGDLK